MAKNKRIIKNVFKGNKASLYCYKVLSSAYHDGLTRTIHRMKNNFDESVPSSNNLVEDTSYIQAVFENPLKINKIDDDFQLERLYAKTLVAIQVHIYYTDLCKEIFGQVNLIPVPFDCYISTDTEKKAEEIREKAKTFLNGAKNIFVEVYENRGRDVAPFIIQMSKRVSEYEYICHIHSKKSVQGSIGNRWRRYLYKHLFGTSQNISGILSRLETEPRIGLIFPETFPYLELGIIDTIWNWRNEKLLKRLSGLNIESLPFHPIFPEGFMFWGRSDALMPLFKLGLKFETFEKEEGQYHSTLAHVIERMPVYIAKSQGYEYRRVFNHCVKQQNQLSHKKKRIALFAHYDYENIVSQSDLYYLDQIRKVADKVVFITNSELDEKEVQAIRGMADQIIIRNNQGFDFGAWKEAILELGFDYLLEYDQLLILNNSVISIVSDMERIFNKMDRKGLDFWGITYSPKINKADKSELNSYIHSYFMAFEKKAIQSQAFCNFWKTERLYQNKEDVISKQESILTKVLAEEGLKYGIYLNEIYGYVKHKKNRQYLYNDPYNMFLLGSPFIKKKSACTANIFERQKLISSLIQLNISYYRFYDEYQRILNPVQDVLLQLNDEVYLSCDVPKPDKMGHLKWLNALTEIGNHNGMRILEIGSREVTGESVAREHFNEAVYVGFDYHPGRNVDIVGDVHKLSSYFKEDEKFDIVYSSACFEHFAMPWIVAVEIAKVLKVGGYLFIETVFAHSSHERPWNFFQFSDLGLQVLFSKALGFECIEGSMSNPIVGRFSSLADRYLRYMPLPGLYCHSSYFGKKVLEVENFEWEKLEAEDIVGNTKYPQIHKFNQ